jgi:ubiquitin-protein ligase
MINFGTYSEGDKVYFKDINNLHAELLNAANSIEQAKADDNFQLGRAIVNHASNFFCRNISTNMNKIELALVGDSELNHKVKVIPSSIFIFKATLDSTTVPTVSVGELVDVSITGANELSEEVIVKDVVYALMYNGTTFELFQIGDKEVEVVEALAPVIQANNTVVEGKTIDVTMTNFDDVTSVIGTVLGYEYAIEGGDIAPKATPGEFLITADNIPDEEPTRDLTIAINVIGSLGETGYSNQLTITIEGYSFESIDSMVISGNDLGTMFPDDGLENAEKTVENTILFDVKGTATSVSVEKQDPVTPWARETIMLNMVKDHLSVDLSSSTASSLVTFNRLDINSVVNINSGNESVDKLIESVNSFEHHEYGEVYLPYHNKYHRCNPFKETSTVDITGWISDGTLPEGLSHSQVVLTDKYCYLLGGWNGSSVINKIYRANLNSDGTISNWIIDNQVLPGVLHASQVVLTDKYCYLLGEHNGSVTNKIYRANLNSDGTISNWIIDNQVIPEVLAYSQVVLTDKYCYLLGGSNGSITNKIYRANINSDGTISNWIIDNQVIPEVLIHSQVVLTDKYCYLLGGYNGSAINKIYRANLNSDGTISNWIIDDNTLLYGGWASQVVQTKNRVWLIGIRDGSTNRNYVQYADITNGEIGVFTAGTNLPGSIGHHMVVVTKNRVYTFGSYAGSNVIYSAPFDGWEIGINGYQAIEPKYETVTTNLYEISDDWNITLPYHNKYHRCNPFKETSTVDITGWIVDDNTLPEGLHASQVVLTDKYCYLLGGYNGSYTNKIYRANINSDGTISNWIIDNQVLPDMLDVSQVVLTDKYCYLLGGRNGSYSNKIYRANLNSDGTISNWIIDNQVLPEVLLRSQVVLTDKYCYLLGGSNGSYTNKIYRANINSDGTISNWIIDNQVLPEVLGYGQVVLTDKYCYLLGGYNGSAINKIYRANINSDGTISNWIIDTNTLLYGGWGSQVVQTKNRVWLIGIRDNYSGNDTNRNYVQYADITNGEIGVFTAGTSLPGDIAHHMVVVTKSRVYTFGSLVGSNAIYSAPFDGWEIYDTLYSTSVNEYVIDISDTSLSNAPESVFEKDTLTIDDSTTTTSLVLADEVKVGDVLNIDGVYTYEVTDVITAGVNFVVDISSLNLTEIPTVVYDNTSCIPITNISVTDSEGTIDYNQLDVESITIEPVTSNVNVQYAPIDLVGTVGKIKIQTTKAELNKIIIELDEATV